MYTRKYLKKQTKQENSHFFTKRKFSEKWPLVFIDMQINSKKDMSGQLRGSLSLLRARVAKIQSDQNAFVLAESL